MYMQKIFTQEDIISYLYGEASPELKNSIEVALDSDFNLLEEATMLNKLKGKLSKVRFRPSSVAIESILDYSRSGQVALA